MTTTTPDTTLTRDQFLAGVRTAGLHGERQSARLTDWLTPFQKTAREVADHLIEGGFLTRFQAERLLSGRTDGFLLGQYVVLDYLGKTDTSRVYKARHRTMNRLVAVQVLRAELTNTEPVREAIRSQARVAARLAHPNVLTLLDVNTAGDRMYLVQEFVDGADLTTLVKTGGPLSIHRACEFARQTALGLQHAHEKGTFHGRLCPKSVLIGRPGGSGPEDKPMVKVSGLAMGRLTGEGCESGFEYLAPEQFADPLIADAASDLYALGGCLHLMLTGLPPFPAATAKDAASQSGNTLPPVQHLRPDVPAPVGVLLNALLAKDPAQRPQSAAEVAAALDPFASITDSAGVIDFSNPPASLGPTTRGELSGLSAFTERPEAVSLWAEIVTDDAASELEDAGQETLDGQRGDHTPLMTVRKRRNRKPPRTSRPTTNYRRLIVNAAIAAGTLAALGIVVIMLKLALK